MPFYTWIIPLTGALIGWITNVIAISLLFHPYKKRAGIQGLLPKNKDRIAKKLGFIIKEHLLDDETLINSVNMEDKIKGVLTNIISELDPFSKALLQNLVEPVAFFLKNHIEKALKTIPETIAVDKIVEEKIKEFDLKELEKIIYSASGHEIRFIQIAGAVLGFIIGAFHILLIKSF